MYLVYNIYVRRKLQQPVFGVYKTDKIGLIRHNTLTSSSQCLSEFFVFYLKVILIMQHVILIKAYNL